MPLLVVNMGAEMIYILQQRLRGERHGGCGEGGMWRTSRERWRGGDGGDVEMGEMGGWEEGG